MKNNILDITKNYPIIQEFISSNKDIVSEDKTVEAILLASTFIVYKGKIVIIKDSLYEASKLYDRLLSLLEEKNLLFYPTEESLQLEAVASSKELLTQRLYCLDKINKLDSFILITNTASIVRFLTPSKTFYSSYINLKKNDVIKMNELVNKLVELGYSKTNKIEQSLEFSSRGGVIDVYSVNYDNPIRIEFFGDEIDSIRTFSLDDQRTIKEIDNVEIIPATDLLYDSNNIKNIELREDNQEEIELLRLEKNYSYTYKYYSVLNNPSSLLDYLSDSLIIYSYLNKIKEMYESLIKEANDFYPNNSYKIYHNIYDILKIKHKEIKLIKNTNSDLEFPLRNFSLGQVNIKQLVILLREYIYTNKVVVSLENNNQINYFKQICEENNLDLYYLSSLPIHNLSYTDQKIEDSVELINDHIIYLSSYDVFGYSPISSSIKSCFKSSLKISDISKLEVNDYVVHEDYGIAKFTGIESVNFDGVIKDYIYLEFAKGKRVGISADNYTSIRKYISKDGYTPKLTLFGGKEWKKTKERIKEKLKDITSLLLQSYLTRTQEIGYACSKDTLELEKEFKESFPYKLTEDQISSIKEIKEDMESNKPMDRILCGDVGFGKTEVAFSAAYKMMLNNKQVCLLCPTTLLARQHYKVALERFKDFPVNISLLSRMVSDKQAKDIINKANEGKVNFIIGTHKVLTKALTFKDLGLLIIDEEQRFGVKHKEAIKQLKQNIDVLTLSATPIPRTMQTALIGLREMSQIKTPPLNRMPIQTYVLEKNYNVIKEVINKELGRKGQIFYLLNNISLLEERSIYLRKLVPNLKIGIIHGQMDKEIVESTMTDFVNGDLDLLLSTTIIENGIDVTNANTIIVEDAERFGLAQLYQIRGRVGRGDKLAYAYLFYSPEKEINDTARKRLKAIKEFAELGSGYKIALRDLTIRGAGDVLGEEQAGFIDSVGIDMYIQLLQEVIQEAKTGKKKEQVNQIHQFMKIDTYIPSTFTDEVDNKLEVYKKISNTNSLEDITSLEQELTDLYGKLPHEIFLLLEKRRFEIYMQDGLVYKLVEDDKLYEIILSEEFSKFDGIGIEIFELCYQTSKDIELGYKENKIRIKIPKNNKWLEISNKLLKKLTNLLKQYQEVKKDEERKEEI